MRNVEQIEGELSQLKDKLVILIHPQEGKVSFSYCGTLKVVNTELHTAFHIASSLGGWAVIFSAEDVERLEPIAAEGVASVIRLLKRA